MFTELTNNGILLTAPYFMMAPQTAVKLALMDTAGSGLHQSRRPRVRLVDRDRSGSHLEQRGQHRASCCSTLPSFSFATATQSRSTLVGKRRSR